MANTTVQQQQQQLTVIDITDDSVPAGPNSSKGGSVSNKSTIRPVMPRVVSKNTSAATPTAITIPQDDSAYIEKRCENPDCAAPTLISLVPTRPIPQFIHNPTVVTEPILVNGYTTVFEVGGMTAKVSELSTVKCADGKIRYKSRKPIYRIVPNTHAHIVNYVIIDAEGETLRKIKQNDPATIKKLLESQRNSAEQLLEKLIGIKKTPPVKITRSVATAPATATSLPVSATVPVNATVPVMAPTPVTATQPQRTLVKVSSTNTGGSMGTLTMSSVSSPAITTPIIASVSSGVSEVVAASGMAPTIAPTVAAQVVSTTTALERMQSELRELRETVKLLTEQKRPSAGSTDEGDPKKQKTS